jgi:hypothetical protein
MCPITGLEAQDLAKLKCPRCSASKEKLVFKCWYRGGPPCRNCWMEARSADECEFEVGGVLKVRTLRRVWGRVRGETRRLVDFVEGT